MAGNIVIIENSEIKGHHIFKITPNEELMLDVFPDPKNRKDPHAMGIYMPNIPECKSQAGRMVGHVKANLAKLLTKGVLDGHIIYLKWYIYI